MTGQRPVRDVSIWVATAAVVVTVSAISLCKVLTSAAPKPADGQPDPSPLVIRTADYPLQVALTADNGVNYSYQQAPGTTNALHTSSGRWNSVSFSRGGVPVTAYAPIDTERTLTCVADGNLATPRISCKY